MMALLPVVAWAAVGDEFAADGLKYKVTSESPKTVELTRFDKERPKGTLTIPATVNGYSVTSIGTYAFKGCDGITSVEIPGSVTSIGTYAFCYCYGLTSVTIGNGVTSIADYAFFSCTHLASLTVPANVRTIGVAAFVACYDLKSVTITAGVTSIGEQAFAKCNSLVSVNIPESVTSLHPMAFKECTNLESITVALGNEHYKSVDGVLFDKGMTTLIRYPENKKLTNYAIPVGVTTLEHGTFFYCNSLVNVSLPESMTTIGDSVFGNCGKLTNINIPENLTSFGQSAFSDCTSLKNITIPKYVTSIEGAFPGCSGIELIEVREGNANYKSIDGVLFNRDCTTLIQFPQQMVNDNYIIPASVTSISANAFSGCNHVPIVTLPDNIASIGDFAFTNFNSLTYINIPESVTKIGDRAFYYCPKLTNITIPDSVTSIGSYAFNGCSGMNKVIIGNGVKSIGYCAFSSCNGIKELIIGTSVASIGQNAFSYCSSLTHVTIPDGLTAIGDNAFFGCGSLSSVFYQGSYPFPNNNVFGSTTVNTVCVSPEYELDKFCGLDVTSSNPICSEFMNNFNRCYKATYVDGGFIQEKRKSTVDWEMESNGCAEYDCTNDGGLVYGICNKSGYSSSRLCANDECVEKDTMKDKGMRVVIELEDGVNITEMNSTEILNMLAVETGIDKNELSIGYEVNQEGYVVRVIVYVRDESNAQLIVEAVNRIEGGDNCEYGLLCHVKTIRVEAEGENLSYSHKNEVLITVLMMMMTMMVVYLFL